MPLYQRLLEVQLREAANEGEINLEDWFTDKVCMLDELIEAGGEEMLPLVAPLRERLNMAMKVLGLIPEEGESFNSRYGKFLLDMYKTTGTIFWSDSERAYLGRAKDGQEVVIGEDEISVMRYLVNRDTPDQW